MYCATLGSKVLCKASQPRHMAVTLLAVIFFPTNAMRREDSMNQPVSVPSSLNASQVFLLAPKLGGKAVHNVSDSITSNLPLRQNQPVTDTQLPAIFEDFTQDVEVILMWMFILLALALVIFIQLSGWPTAVISHWPKYVGGAQELLLQDFEQLARRLQGKVQKYSTSCIQAQFGSPVLRDRFVSVVPASSGGQWNSVHDWLKAELRWWESESVFNEGLPPRGSVVLENIMTFYQEPKHEDHQGCLTLLRSRKGAELCELRLVFPTPQASFTFCNDLWEFFQKMQDAESSINGQGMF